LIKKRPFAPAKIFDCQIPEALLKNRQVHLYIFVLDNGNAIFYLIADKDGVFVQVGPYLWQRIAFVSQAKTRQKQTSKDYRA
jgi:hypothetical protein